MDVARAEAFLAVAEEMHFGRAAQRLHMAQSPLSRLVQRLERELGCALFERTTRSVRLTKTGEALVAPARELVAAARRADHAVQEALAGETGTVNVAFAGASTHRLIADLARRIRHDRPGISLRLESNNFALPLMRRLVAGEIDIALGRWDTLPAAVTAEVIAHDALVLAVPDTHALADHPGVDGTQLAGLRFVSLVDHEGAVLPDRLHRIASTHRFAADIVQIAPDTQTALALVAAEVGCHITLRSVADAVNDPHLRFIAVHASVPDVHLRAAARNDEQAAVVRAVLERLPRSSNNSHTAMNSDEHSS